MNTDLVFSHFPNLTDDQKAQFESLLPLYEDWNSKINVISRKDLHELYIRHVLHSLSIAKFVQFNPSASILDIGTGGGFPGIPLAILYPNVRFQLVDSIGKKIKVVKEVASELDLKNIEATHQRAEAVSTGPFDFIVSRAVARSKQLLQWTHSKFKAEHNHSINNGYILLKGGDLSEEMNELNKPYQEQLISDYFKEDFFETKKVIYIPRG